jgi:hypothetical protein
MAEVRTRGVVASLRGAARRTLKRVPFVHRIAKEAVVGLKLARYRSDRQRRDHALSPDRLWQAPIDVSASLLDRATIRAEAQRAGVAVDDVAGGFRLAPGDAGPRVLGPITVCFPADASYLVLTAEAAADADRHGLVAAAHHAAGGARLFDLIRLGQGDSAIPVLVGENRPGSMYDAEAVPAGFDRDAVIDAVIAEHEATLHFGDVLTVVRGGDRFLYQDVPGRSQPGRRDTDARVRAMTEMMARHGAGFEGRVVLDVCCNSGMMMGEALARGARWSVGWDLPEVAAAADDLLTVLGAGRSEVHGVVIDDDTAFAAGVPDWLDADDSVCLFLAAWHHVRFPPGVGDLPWTWLVYEGQENENPSHTRDNIATMETRWSCRLVDQSTHSDGICGPRPLALFERV